MNKLLCLIFLLFAVQQVDAQQQEVPTGQVELFCGATLGYADTNWLRLYDVQINATPGVRWHLGHDWTIAAQGLIPVISEGYTFRDRVNKYYRINLATVSRQLHFNEAKQHLKLSAGWFGEQQYGLDVRWMWPVTSWLLLQAQSGLTAHWLLGADLHGNYNTDMEKRFSPTGLVGANVYLQPWNLEFRLSGGRYIAKDYGLQFDMMRHFSHCTLLAFAQLHVGKLVQNQYERQTYRSNGGFKIIMMLPPYKKSTQKTVIRPASNFRLTYNARSDEQTMRMYTTDPEENERELQVDVDWGYKAVTSEKQNEDKNE